MTEQSDEGGNNMLVIHLLWFLYLSVLCSEVEEDEAQI